MKKTKKDASKSAGTKYYRGEGLTKSLLIHVSPATHADLTTLAAKEERSVQVTARRILEEHLKNSKS